MHSGDLFDADAYAEALAPPRFKYRGRLYTGRPLSEEEWVRFDARVQQAARKEMSDAEFTALTRELVDAMFRRPWWGVWRRRAVDIVMRLPPALRQAAFVSFLEAQARAMTGTPRARTTAATATPEDAASPPST